MVGGGPAGLAAAEVLAAEGQRVTVYERMPSVGRKLLIAGRGGLNLTHSEPLPAFLDRYHPAHVVLRKAVETFPPNALRDWCEGLGQPTFVGSSGRVFPKNFKASPLLRAWLARLGGLGVTIRTRHRLTTWDGTALSFEGPDGAVEIRPRACLFAMGGASWPRLGSDGAWVSLLRSRGVAVAPLLPANVGFAVRWSEHFAGRFAGEPVKRVGLRLGDKQVRGEAMISAQGIEGGAVYALSREIREAIQADGAATLVLDLRPDLNAEALAQRLGHPKPGASLATRLRKNAGLSPVAAGLLREAYGRHLPDTPAALAASIKAASLRLLEPAPIARAISTAGGVSFDELDARFMLRAHPGSFLAGEMLDWEAPTGGYLLQASFASGRAAASGLIDWLRETRG
ncbi:NAD(FAD)-utilizing dehydrogenase [Methylobacterium gnaphalii]|uniref:NAD(FAD)-utilizing dehydrogenase n=1 Tax=Methylobacterium gnaphalii TaxID=1010610 RepID=A0A512JH14_9HYPH|nr:NAD(FAD)-utilizing dehydrogenase [Methylobacterium gnaphalii]GLS49250.1 NAD(FAD)-utilizing dehydrogenase [Methylobacterium gnaphalii]